MAKKRAPKKHQRRKTDREPSTSEKVGQGVAGSALLIGWCAFLYQMIEMLQRHSDWAWTETPPGWAEVLSAMLYASIGFGGALFTDFRKMLDIVRHIGGRP